MDKMTQTQQLHQDIQHWTHMRQDLLRQYFELSGLSDTLKSKPLSNQLDDFFHHLIDYTAHGHFSFYEKLLRNITIGHSEKKPKLDKLIAKILKITHKIVDTFDTHEQTQATTQLISPLEVLSHVGELIATRFELEDELVTHCLQN